MIHDTASVIEKWPDVIACGTSDNKAPIFFISGYDNTKIWYGQPGAGSHIWVQFYSDGTYQGISQKGNQQGCKGKSIRQLYNEGRAFHFVNDPKQKEEIQNIKEENNLLREQIKKITQKSNARFELLEETIKELQKNMPKEITSDDCFKLFKENNVEMCIKNTDTRMTTLEPSLTIAKSNICIEGNIFGICIEKFEEKGIVICGETPEYKMFE